MSSNPDTYKWSVFIVGVAFIAISLIVFYGSIRLSQTGSDNFLKAAFGMTVAGLLFSIGVGSVFQNEAMSNIAYTFLSANDTPASALTTSWGDAGYADASSYPGSTVKKFDSRRTIGAFPFVGTLLPTAVTGATSAPTFASLNPLLPSTGAAAAVSPTAVQATATASPAQAMQLGGISSGVGTAQAVPFSARPIATV